MSEKQKSKRIFYGFLILLTLINLLQSFATELILDESYYWYFSKNLDWGYFDHPPMVAFLVKIGSALFNKELGVRFFSAFLFSGTIYFLWKAIDNTLKYENVKLFCVLTASVALFNVYGFFMLPDTPLLFFAALFLWAYKKFLEQEKTLHIIILAISMTGMMYSKYHAVLVIGFIIASNIKLLFNKRFWTAAILALILYSPHLYWLYENDFNSLKYHLIERANSKYKISFTLDYLLGFFTTIGLAFPVVYWSFYNYKKETVFDKGLSFIVYGIFIFFLISSFNRRTQAQWTLLVMLPLIIISFKYALHHQNIKKWLYRLSTVGLIIILFLRVALIDERVSPILYESHGNKKWVAELQKKSKGRPIVFRNSYTNATMYSFYSGIDAISANGFPFRENQFDLDSSEYKFQRKDVAFLSAQKDADATFEYTQKRKNIRWKGIFLDNYFSYRKLKITLDEKGFNTSGKDSISFQLKNPYHEKIKLSQLKFYGLTLTQKKAVIDTLYLSLRKNLDNKIILPKESIKIKAKLENPDKLKGASFFRITIRENNLPMGFQGNIISLEK
ncbi:hypothetical protein GTQ40_10015 [Flavobacteriaceae bacterium R38]|nr:hypothetical protein [Flavobacteriaceae bacterium R38]